MLIFEDESELADLKNPPEHELICVAILGIKDPLRPEVIHAIDRCKGAGINVMMVTGDSTFIFDVSISHTSTDLHTAIHIGTECGIYEQNVGVALEGKQFREMSVEQRNEILPKLQILARSVPMDKHLLVTSLKRLGQVVGVTGDGTNDAAALRAANVGLSMGSGTEVAKEASDIVIMDDNFASIVRAVLWGRSVYENIRKFLQFQLSINIVALVITFVGSITDRGFPLTAAQ